MTLIYRNWKKCKLIHYNKKPIKDSCRRWSGKEWQGRIIPQQEETCMGERLCYLDSNDGSKGVYMLQYIKFHILHRCTLFCIKYAFRERFLKQCGRKSSFFKFLINLKGKKREQRDMEIFHALPYSPNAPNGQNGAKPKQGAGNPIQVSIWVAETQPPELSPVSQAAIRKKLEEAAVRTKHLGSPNRKRSQAAP